MKINVLVKLNAKSDSLELLADGSYVVRVSVPPVDGKANERVQGLLAKFLKLPKSRVSLVAGTKSKRKVFKIL